MNHKLLQYRAIAYIVLFYLAAALLAVGPFGILKKDRTVMGNETIRGAAQVRLDCQVQQVFIAEGTYLRYLDVYVTSPDSAGETYRLYVYDENNQRLINREIAMPQTELPGFLRIPMGIETEPGTAYVWQLQGKDVPMDLAVENTGETGLTVFGNYYVVADGETTMYEAQNVVMRLIYTDSPAAWKMAALYAGLVLLAVGLIGFVLYQGRQKQRLGKEMCVKHVLWLTVGPVAAIFALYLLYAVFVLDLFGGKWEDKLVYALGIGIAAVYFGWVLFARRLPQKELPFKILIREKGMDWLQSAVFAGVLLGCVHFMNAQYQIYQDLAYREVLVWSGLLLLTMGGVKELFNKKCALWTAAAGLVMLVAYEAYKTHLAEGKTILDVKLLRNDFLIVLVAGLVLILLIGKIRNRQFDFSGIKRGYALLLAAFFVLIIVFRNTRGWPLYLVLVFGLFYLFYSGCENRDRLLDNFCNGVMLNFALAVIFCMARRPYRAWVYSRYNFVFHTVTITATYLTLVVCALTVRLLGKLHAQKKVSLIDMWGTLLFYGLAVAFLFMTLSRTGYLAVIAMTAVIVPFVCFFVCKAGFGAFIRDIACMIVAAVLCLPVAYSGVRLLPALYNDPYIYEVEESAAAIHRDDPKDSNAYMSVSYFKYVMENKLFSDASDEAKEGKLLLAAIKGEVYIEPNAVLVASEADSGLSDLEEFSNGRFEIFRCYMDNWNLTGHDEMGVPLPDGSISVHAHNTYLQVIHDFGLITGAVYLLFGAVSFIKMFGCARRNRGKGAMAALPLAVFIGFAVAGLVEWLFHPCNPLGFSVMVVFAPLLDKKK